MKWLKDKAAWIAGILLTVIGFFAMIITLGRVRPKKPIKLPPKPGLDDVKVPDAKKLDTTPADEYREKKVEPADDIEAAIKRLNERHD